VAQQQVGGGGRGKRRGHSLLPGLQVIQNGFFLFFFFLTRGLGAEGGGHHCQSS
jgi:hypothetical protein